jgi:hypothetical protein
LWRFARSRLTGPSDLGLFTGCLTGMDASRAGGCLSETLPSKTWAGEQWTHAGMAVRAERRFRERTIAMTCAPSILPPTASSLRTLVRKAYATGPADPLISPVGEQAYSTLFDVIPATLAVLRVAAEIEPDPVAMMAWYRRTPIRELGNLPAEALVALGRTEIVITFLRSIRDGRRG